MNKEIKGIGNRIGFLVGFLAFSSMAYLILNLTEKISNDIKYWHIVLGVFILYFFGLILRKGLKNE